MSEVNKEETAKEVNPYETIEPNRAKGGSD
jgi:hypothetical protein